MGARPEKQAETQEGHRVDGPVVGHDREVGTKQLVRDALELAVTICDQVKERLDNCFPGLA